MDRCITRYFIKTFGRRRSEASLPRFRLVLALALWVGLAWAPVMAQQQCAVAKPLCPDPGLCFGSHKAQDDWARAKNCTFITLSMLKAANPTGSDAEHSRMLGYINKFARLYEVNTPERIAHFLSQVAHESGFKTREENLKYSAKRMRAMFGCKGGEKNYIKAGDDCKNGRLREKLWSQEAKYANNPENLGSFVYGGRNDNGDEASGDGYKFRGRGIIQLSFRSNYQAFENHHNKLNPDDIRSFTRNPELIAENIEYGVESAFYFWASKGLNYKSDTGTVCQVTKVVNGGANGYADRQERFNNVACTLGVARDSFACG